MGHKRKKRIKPLIDFADIVNGKERVFYKGRYYTVPEDKAKKYRKENKALIREEWKEGDNTCSTYR